MPFVNLSADQENEYFVDGMTEELISRLSRIKGIDVIARTSIMQYKGKQVSIADVGRDLNVNTVLEGSVRKAGDKVRITVQLIDAATQGHLWSQDYDRNLKDIFSTQSDISGRVAEALHIVLESADKSGGSFRNVDDTQTYSLYLKGRYYWGKITPEGLRKAIEYFEQAVARSPKDARSWAGLADAHTWLAWNSFAAPTESFPKAKAAAEKALSLDENLADAHASLGLVRFLFEWDWAGAEESFRRAIELAPSNAMAHLWYGIWAKALGLNAKAVAEMRRAVELDPLSLLASAEIGWVAYYGRRFGEAERSCRKTLEMDRDFLFALQCLTFALTLQKNPEAIAVAKRITELTPGDPYMLGQLGWVYGALNKQRDAERVLNTLKEMARKQPVPPTALYQVYSGLRDTRSAIDALEQVQQQRGADVIWIKAGPEFDPLREDPRFLSLLRSMKFPP